MLTFNLSTEETELYEFKASLGGGKEEGGRGKEREREKEGGKRKRGREEGERERREREGGEEERKWREGRKEGGDLDLSRAEAR